MYNKCSLNGTQPPDLIISDQDLFEAYENYGVEAAQIVKREGGLADLGFETMIYKGKDWVWTDACIHPDEPTKSRMMFLNTKNIHIYYDPRMWFDVTKWKEQALTTDRLAHILCAVNITSDQLRVFGQLYEG